VFNLFWSLLIIKVLFAIYRIVHFAAITLNLNTSSSSRGVCGPISLNILHNTGVGDGLILLYFMSRLSTLEDYYFNITFYTTSKSLATFIPCSFKNQSFRIIYQPKLSRLVFTQPDSLLFATRANWHLVKLVLSNSYHFLLNPRSFCLETHYNRFDLLRRLFFIVCPSSKSCFYNQLSIYNIIAKTIVDFLALKGCTLSASSLVENFSCSRNSLLLDSTSIRHYTLGATNSFLYSGELIVICPQSAVFQKSLPIPIFQKLIAALILSHKIAVIHEDPNYYVDHPSVLHLKSMPMPYILRFIHDSCKTVVTVDTCFLHVSAYLEKPTTLIQNSNFDSYSLWYPPFSASKLSLVNIDFRCDSYLFSISSSNELLVCKS